MTHEHNLAFLVYKENMRNATRAIGGRGSAFSIIDVIVLDGLPFFALNMGFDYARVVVDTETDDSHVGTPLFFVFGEHLLVVCHGSLAWRTPGGP